MSRFRKIDTRERFGRKAVIGYNSLSEEYQVRFWIAGEPQLMADYYTSDKDDAINTAEVHLKAGEGKPEDLMTQRPTVVLEVSGGVIHLVSSTIDIRVVIVNADCEGADPEELVRVPKEGGFALAGRKAYVSEHVPEPNPEYVQSLVKKVLP